MLRQNDDKTEVVPFAPAYVAKVIGHFVVDSFIISSSSVRHLGVLFDKTLSMESQVSDVCRSAYAQLRNIGLIPQYLTSAAACIVVCGLVTSRLDWFRTRLLASSPSKEGRSYITCSARATLLLIDRGCSLGFLPRLLNVYMN